MSPQLKHKSCEVLFLCWRYFKIGHLRISEPCICFINDWLSSLSRFVCTLHLAVMRYKPNFKKIEQVEIAHFRFKAIHLAQTCPTNDYSFIHSKTVGNFCLVLALIKGSGHLRLIKCAKNSKNKQVHVVEDTELKETKQVNVVFRSAREEQREDKTTEMDTRSLLTLGKCFHYQILEHWNKNYWHRRTKFTILQRSFIQDPKKTTKIFQHYYRKQSVFAYAAEN